MTPIRSTIDYLRLCQTRRAAGLPVSYTNDPQWLLNLAINRRAGWPDDPSEVRGSARPTTDGRYPPKASGSRWWHLVLLAGRINTPRLIVRIQELGEHRWLVQRVPNRFLTPEEE